MQLLLLALVAAIFVHDALPAGVSTQAPAVGWAGLLAVAVLPKAAVVAAYAGLCRWARRRLNTRASAALRRLDRLGGAYRVAVLVLLLVDLYVGVLAGLRQAMGDLVLLDELIVLAGPMAMLIAAWWLYYPIDRRLREAAMLRRIDVGQGIPPIWSRRQFVLTHLRHEVALILLPLLLILAWYECVPLVLGPAATESWRLTAQIAGALVIFTLAPLIIRFVWDTRPMPQGELRDMLVDLCDQHGVRVREVLLWRTAGGVVNAAVMGVFAPVRYILLSDALLEQMPRPHVEAVMAHELGHVKRHHMFWLAASAVATVGVVEAGLTWALATGLGVSLDLAGDGGPAPQLLLLSSALGAATAWVVVFGWVSRRAERQADAFAVQHLAGEGPIASEHAHAMVAALQNVAVLNHIPTGRHNWRHGSIAWRQAYLRSLVGQPAHRLGIDHVMNRVKLATAVAAAVTVALHLWGLPPT